MHLVLSAFTSSPVYLQATIKTSVFSFIVYVLPPNIIIIIIIIIITIILITTF